MTTRFRTFVIMALFSLAVGLTTGPSPAMAELKAMGPIDGGNGFPVWYQDTNSVALELCLDLADPMCLQPIPVPNPNGAVVFPTNFPDEAFWWVGETSISLGSGGSALLVLALEAAFANGDPAPGDQVSFGRIRIRVDAPVAGTYTVTHPYGSREFVVTAPGVGAINDTRDIGLTGVKFVGILDPAENDTTPPDTWSFGPFLRWDGSAPTDPLVTAGRYLGNPSIPHAVTGSPFNTNYFRIDGPAGSNIGGTGVDFIQSDLFVVSGKVVGLGVAPYPTVTSTAVVGTPVDTVMTVTNLTSAPVAFTNTNPDPLAITGTDLADFSIISDTCTGQTIPVITTPGTGTCTFTLRFNPVASAVAARSATLTITSTDTAVVPAVSVALAGTAQFSISPTVAGNGTITPATPQVINAGGNFEFTLTPGTTSTFPRVLVDNAYVPQVGNKVTFSALASNHTVDVKFLRAGDLNEDGSINSADALRGLQIALGVGVNTTSDERVAGDVGPLVSSLPKADGSVDVSDVMLILRRSLGMDPLW